MKIYQCVISVGLCIILMGFIACASAKKPNDASADAVDFPSSSNASSKSGGNLDATADTPTQGISNMADERFELLSLVFRLAGREEYGDVSIVTVLQNRVINIVSL